MKKFLFFTLLLFALAYVSAQNVGIGTTTPGARLDVKTTSSYVSQFNGGSQMYIGLLENDVFRGYVGSFAGSAEDVDFGTGSGNTQGKLHLTIQSSPKLSINNSGQVGIGTTSPDAQLHVTGGDMFFNTTTGFFRLGYVGANQWRIGTLNSGADLTWHTSTDGTNFTNRHLFRQNGDVGLGVGITSPIGRLEVKGAGTTSSTNNLVLRNSTSDTLLRMRDDGRMGVGYNGTNYSRTINLGGNGINFFTNDETLSGAIFPTDTSVVIWSNSSSNNYVVLQPSWGNTGIGTYTPNAKLHVNGAQLIGTNSSRIAVGYSLSVDGRVMAEEFTTQNSTSWPDYVFEKDYTLMPLAQLRDYTSLNKHLPNIPDAATMEKNGIKLGDMVTKLTQKVEELTLYILEMDQQNNEMKQQIELLKKSQLR